MYAEFKGTPAERAKGTEVSLAEQHQLLTQPGALPQAPIWLQLTASQFMSVRVQVGALQYIRAAA